MGLFRCDCPGWAVDRLQGRDGIVCLVTNNSFIEQVAFDGMRKHLLQDFTQIFHIDLHGNVRKNPKLSGTTHNVFGIQVGVGITVAVRVSDKPASELYYYRVPENWRKTEKLAFLTKKGSITEIEWRNLQPDERYTWINEGIRSEFSTFLPIGSKDVRALSTSRSTEVNTIFKRYSPGSQTNRDNWMYDFNASRLALKARRMIETYNAELSRWIRAGSPQNVDDFVLRDEKKIKWSSRLKDCFIRRIEASFNTSSIRNAYYRPFTHKFIYFDSIMTHRQGMFPATFPTLDSEIENSVICLEGIGVNQPFHCLISNCVTDAQLLSNVQCFPYYTYSEDGRNKRDNITDWALAQYQAEYGPDVTKRDIFSYVYAVLHHPLYCKRYAENLKHELPRIPLLKEHSAFELYVRIGKELMELHLNYEQASEFPLKWVENREVPVNWRVEKMRLTPNKDALVVNEWLTLIDIPQECFQYRLGNRSALEWVIDQYQVSTDARSGITNDPNRDDEPEYIVRLVGRVVTVSVETMKLVEELVQAVNLVDEIGVMVEGQEKTVHTGM